MFVPQAPERGAVTGPVRSHLHPNFEKDLAPEKLLHVATRGARNRLELGAVLADHDRLVIVFLHDDRRVDPPQAPLLLELVDADRAAVRQLLAEEAEQLL